MRNSKEGRASVPVAVVGIGCRFPGGVSNPADFWRLMVNKTDAITEIPRDRWDYKKFYHPTTDKPGKTYTRWGGFLNEDVYGFDPLFFGISPREAEGMDPQQCYALRVTYEALEDAGLSLGDLRGTNTGVFIGGFTLDNKLTQLAESSLHLVDANTATSISMAILASRVSHAFDFRGPSLSLDTACSSSMVAVHLAVQNIRSGDCDVAVAGGVTIMTRPEYPVIMSNGGYLSKHGRCMAFDERAEGYTRGEGCGVLVLKPLDRALASGDHIYSVIRNTGINQDGATKGIAFPNSDAQQALIERVYSEAGLGPADMQVVEAHGTGTQAGDTAECDALHRVISQSERSQPLVVGSVKTNIGHLEAAAGVAGLIKACLMVNKSTVLPNIHFETPNPKIPFEEMNLRIPVDVEAWPPHEGVRRMSINSFGYGGTNAHTVLESCDHIVKARTAQQVEEWRTASAPAIHDGHLYLLPLSAQDEGALRTLAGLYASQLDGVASQAALHDLLHSATHRRSFHRHRVCVAGANASELSEQLRQFASGDPSPMAHNDQTRTATDSPLVFVCTGMGPQWHAMGMALYECEPVFRAFIDRADQLFTRLSGWSLLAEMQKEGSTSRMAQTEVAQPANFVLQAGLFELYKHYGLHPDVVTGHSVGEVASAYISGALDLSDSLLVSYLRSKLQATLAGTGTMLAAAISEQQARVECEAIEGIEIAAINGPDSVTFAGNHFRLERLAAELKKRAVFNRMMSVEVPYHSSKMDKIKDDLLAGLSGLQPTAPDIPVYSTVSATNTGELPDAEYWWRNVRQPVRFADTIQAIAADYTSPFFLEIGPHPVLKTAIAQSLQHDGQTGLQAHTLDRKQPEVLSMRMALARVFAQGYKIDWQAANQLNGRYVKLPAYPWSLNSYRRMSDAMVESLLGRDGHVMFDQCLNGVNPSWEFEVNSQMLPWLPDHVVDGSVVMPGAAYVEFGLALAMRKEITEQEIKESHSEGITGVTLQDLRFHRVLVDQETIQTRLLTSIDPATGQFNINSRVLGQQDSSSRHASGRIIRNAAPAALKCDIDPDSGASIDVEQFYQQLEARGLHYGPAFRTVKSIKRLSNQRVVARLEMAAFEDGFHSHYRLHPTLLDGAFQSMLALVENGSAVNGSSKPAYVPVSIDKLHLIGSVKQALFCLSEITESGPSFIVADITLFDELQQVCVCLRGVRCQALAAETSVADPLQGLYHEMRWVPCEIPLEPVAKLTGNWLLFGPPSLTNQCLASGLFANCQSVCLSSHENIDSTLKQLTDHSQLTDVIFLDAFEPLGGIDAEADLDFYSRKVLQVQALLENHTSNEVTVHVLTQNAHAVVQGDSNNNLLGATLNAFGLLVENEHPNLQYRFTDLGSAQDLSVYLRPILSKTVPFRETAYRNRQCYRHQLVSTHIDPVLPIAKNMDLQRHSVAVCLEEPGNVDSLCLKQVVVDDPADDEVQIRVHASSLNFKDVLKVYGQLAESVINDTYCGDTLGVEASGVVTCVGKSVSGFTVGDEVIGVMPDSFRSLANVRADYVMLKPDSLSQMQAPTLVTYLTAWYGLIDKAELQDGESVLIHNASGGVGYVALQIAWFKGACVFATAGTEEKRQHLRELGVEHVYDSRSLVFADQIRRDTNGRGVDVVLNAMAGEAVSQSFELLAPFGRFIEIGKKNIADNNGLPMRAFQDNLTFAAVDIDRMLFGRTDIAVKLIADVKNAFAIGCFGPVPVKAFTADRAADAFQFMARSQHVGKVVLNFTDTIAPVIPVDVRNGAIRSDGSYLVTGGTSGFGLEIAKWLASQGAGELVLVSRSGSSAETDAATAEMMAYGSRVRVLAVDVSSEPLVAELIESFDEQLPLRGIFHAAVVLEDGFINTLQSSSLEKVLRPKMLAALYLHRLTAGKSLDIFFCFSSISALVGNTGQASYVIANAYLDALCHYRRSIGLAGTSLNWGAISEVGILSRKAEVAALFEKQGLGSIAPPDACQIMDRVLTSNPAQIGAFQIDWARSASSTFTMANVESRFATVVGSGVPSGKTDSLVAAHHKLRETCPGDMKFADFVQSTVLEQISSLLKIPVDQIDVNRNIIQMGIDSLSAVELGVALRAQLGVEYSPVQLLAGPTPLVIGEIALKAFESAEAASTVTVSNTPVVDPPSQPNATAAEPAW